MAACDDLHEIWSNLGGKHSNPDAADQAISDIQNTIKSLRAFPRCGQRHPQYESLRRVFTGEYGIYYEVGDQIVEVARIIHQRRHREDAMRHWLSG